MSDGVVDEQRVLRGRYRLVAPIARGGMAEVWEGLDEVLTRSVAVKLLHAHLAADERIRERFRLEAVAAARLAHPNVVATFDSGDEGDIPFIVMELVRGDTLRDLIDQGAVRPALARDIALQVSEALAAAHRTGIVHRDVKPGNILLCDGVPPGAPGAVKVADFGIARAALDVTGNLDLTQPGMVLGTAKYLAPEQAQGGEPDGRSDVYSLGVVLYEMLTGRPPFVAATPMATALAHVNTEPVRPRHLRARIPRALEDVVLAAMAKDPADRYQSAEELAAALRSIDLGRDDAVPSVVRDPTPPAGLPAAFHRSERTWILPAAVIVVAAVALVALAMVLGRSDLGRGILDRRQGDGAATPVAVRGIDVLDPTDQAEKNDRLPAAIDANPATSWETSHYTTREFGGLKAHLGLRLDLGSTQHVGRVVVTSPGSGWDAELYVADTNDDALAGWGAPLERLTGVGGTATFDGLDARGRYVLVLFTRLAENNRVEVQEVAVFG